MNTTEETIQLNQILMDELLQVRNKIDDATVRRYAGEMERGAEFPPIRLAKVDNSLLLIDGWHRVRANRSNGQKEIAAIVTTMSREEAVWQAAEANTKHGLPLKRGEGRNVFKAYVSAGKHKAGRKIKSYREIAADLPTVGGHTTIRNWMQKDFPKVYKAMGGYGDHPNPSAEPPRVDIDGQRYEQAKEAMEDALNCSNLLGDPEIRYRLIMLAESMLVDMKTKPHVEPILDDF